MKRCKKTKEVEVNNRLCKRRKYQDMYQGITSRFAAMLLTLVLFTTLLSGCTTTSKDQWDTIQQRGYLIVGLDDTFAPMGFRDENNELVGFDVDMAKALTKQLGLELRLQPIDWSMKETELNNKSIDVIWNGYTITEERKKKVNFSTPYMSNRQVIVVMKNSLIKSKTDLIDKTIAVQRQSSALDALLADAQLASQFKGGAPVEFDTNLEVFMDLESGRVDAIVVDEVLADYVIKQRGPENYRYLEEDFGSEEYGIGVRKTDERLLQEINQMLENMKTDGSYDAIVARWFGTSQ